MARMVRTLIWMMAGGALLLHAAPVSKIEAAGLSSSKGICSVWWNFEKGEQFPSYFARLVQDGAGVEVGFSAVSWSEESQNVNGQGVASLRSVQKVHSGKPLLLFQLKLKDRGVSKLNQRLEGSRFVVEWNCSEKKDSQWTWPVAVLKKPEVVAKKADDADKKIKTPQSLPPATTVAPPSKESPSAEPLKKESKPEPKREKTSGALDQFYKEVSGELSSDKEKMTGFVIQGSRRLVVNRQKVLLYSKPDPQSLVIRLLALGDTLFSAQKKGNWYVVDNGNRYAYVSVSDVRRLEELTTQDEEMLRRLVHRQISDLSADQKKVSLHETEVGGEVVAGASSDSLDIPPSRAGKQYYRYSSFGRRDPLVPFEEPEIDGISIDEVQLVGIIWDEETSLAILEDVRVKGVSYTLREGDEVLNGNVYKISRDEVVFLLTEFGVSRKYSMPLPKIIE